MLEKLITLLTSNRFKSFYWRASMMVLAGFISLLADNIGVFEFSAEITTVLGLILGELSKTLNNRYGRIKT